jgi:hypothetical protein
LVWHF